MDYIKDVFLGQIRTDNSDALNEASLLLDSWKALTDIDVLREHGMKKPLLQSASVIKKCIDAMHSYMQTLPLYCEHFLTMMCTTVCRVLHAVCFMWDRLCGTISKFWAVQWDT